MIDIHNMSVLIVDDMDSMCKSIRAIMRVLGYGKTFRFALNGLDAWNLLKKEQVHLSIVDYHMPEMTNLLRIAIV